MELFAREKTNYVENIDVNTLVRILENKDDEVSVDYKLYDTLFLTDGKSIKCINNYYETKENNSIKKNKSTSGCPLVQSFFGLNCQPFECVGCHLAMLRNRKSKIVKIKLKKR